MYEYRTLFIHIEFLDFKIWQYFFSHLQKPNFNQPNSEQRIQ